MRAGDLWGVTSATQERGGGGWGEEGGREERGQRTHWELGLRMRLTGPVQSDGE